MEHLVQVLQALEVRAEFVARLDLPVWNPAAQHDHQRDALVAIAALAPLALIN